jgi:hypothetical protein
MYSYLVHTTPKPSGKNYTSVKPKPHPMQDAYWKKDSASYQEAPKAMCKTSEDVGQPSKATQQTNKFSHHLSL